jgi:hypothetical protein
MYSQLLSAREVIEPKHLVSILIDRAECYFRCKLYHGKLSVGIIHFISLVTEAVLDFQQLLANDFDLKEHEELFYMYQ